MLMSVLVNLPSNPTEINQNPRFLDSKVNSLKGTLPSVIFNIEVKAPLKKYIKSRLNVKSAENQKGRRISMEE
jgi:hypothetical protein